MDENLIGYLLDALDEPDRSRVVVAGRIDAGLHEREPAPVRRELGVGHPAEIAQRLGRQRGRRGGGGGCCGDERGAEPQEPPAADRIGHRRPPAAMAA